MTHSTRTLSVIATALTLVSAVALSPEMIAGEKHSAQSISSTWQEQSVGFFKNEGQWEESSDHNASPNKSVTPRFMSYRSGLRTWIDDDGMTFDIHRITRPTSDAISESGANSVDGFAKRDERDLGFFGSVVKLNFIGRSAGVKFEQSEFSTAEFNFFKGNDESKWARKIHPSQGVTARNVYSGIDISYQLQSGFPRFDFHCKPFSNPHHIAFSLDGTSGLAINTYGAVVMHTSVGDVELRNLKAYQMVGRKENIVDCRFVIQGNVVRFELGSYDHTRELIIDPLVWSTFIGGFGHDFLIYSQIAFDEDKNVYLAGYSFLNGARFPTSTGAYQTTHGGDVDAVVSKLNSSGTALTWSTFVGGSGDDRAWAMCLDGNRNVYFTGYCNNGNYPTTSGAYDRTFNAVADLVATRIDDGGATLGYSTYIGGTGNDQGFGIAIDGTNAIYVTGKTDNGTEPYPTTTGAYDVTANGGWDTFISKINGSGSSLTYSTLVGGGGDDFGQALALDVSGRVYITGYTVDAGVDYPTSVGSYDVTHNGGDDVFISCLNENGAALSYSTFVGGSSTDRAFGLVIDGDNNAYICGYSTSNNFPTSGGAMQTARSGGDDMIVSKISSSGATLTYSSYYGGPNNDRAYGIALDPDRRACVVGYCGRDYPTTSGAYQTTFGGGDADMSLLKVGVSGTVAVYASYLGGGAIDIASCVVNDIDGVSLVGGYTYDNTFPTTTGAYDVTYNGDGQFADIVLTKVAFGYGTISVTAPNGGESWAAGTTQTITWTATNTSTKVKIDYSSDAGRTYSSVTANTTASTGSYSWVIPTTLTGTQFRIRVSDTSNSSVNDVSNANFTVLTVVTISITLDKQILWPPDRGLQTVTATVSLTNGGSPTWRLKSISSGEQDLSSEQGDLANDIQGADTTVADVTYQLRSERLSGEGGRTYKLTYRVTDQSYVFDRDLLVVVPRNLGTAKYQASGCSLTVNHPSPRTITTIDTTASFSFSIPSTTTVTVRVYSKQGKDVAVPVNGVSYASGNYSFTWNGKGRDNQYVKNGDYFLYIDAGCGNTKPVAVSMNR